MDKDSKENGSRYKVRYKLKAAVWTQHLARALLLEIGIQCELITSAKTLKVDPPITKHPLSSRFVFKFNPQFSLLVSPEIG